MKLKYPIVKYFTYLLPFFLVWIVLIVVNIKSQSASDGITEIGFPFPFYREFNGKGIPAKLEFGLLIKYFLIDIGLVILTAIGFSTFITKEGK